MGKRISKMQAENQLLERNKAKKDTSKKFHNASHEKAPKKQAALSSKWDNDWEKIEKQRAEIKAIKEKKKKEKREKDNILKERNKKKKETDKKFKNAHEKKPKKIAPKERVGTDWDKIEKQRAEIKALKEKKRREKAEKAEAEAEAAIIARRKGSFSKNRSKKKLQTPKKKTAKKKKSPKKKKQSSSEEN